MKLIIIASVYLVLIVILAVILHRSKLKKPQRRIILGLSLVSAGVSLFMSREEGVTPAEINRREDQYQQAQGLVMGQYLDKEFGSKKMLCVVPFGRSAEFKAVISGLQAGLRDPARLQFIETIPKVDNRYLYSKTAPPRSFLKNEKNTERDPDALTEYAAEYQRAVDSAPGVHIIVFLKTPPYFLSAMPFWFLPEEQRPKVILMSYNNPDAYEAIDTGKVYAASYIKPGLGLDQQFARPSGDPEKDAQFKYQIIDRKNIKAFLGPKVDEVKK